MDFLSLSKIYLALTVPLTLITSTFYQKRVCRKTRIFIRDYNRDLDNAIVSVKEFFSNNPKIRANYNDSEIRDISSSVVFNVKSFCTHSEYFFQEEKNHLQSRIFFYITFSSLYFLLMAALSSGAETLFFETIAPSPSRDWYDDSKPIHYTIYDFAEVFNFSTFFSFCIFKPKNLQGTIRPTLQAIGRFFLLLSVTSLFAHWGTQLGNDMGNKIFFNKSSVAIFPIVFTLYAVIAIYISAIEHLFKIICRSLILNCFLYALHIRYNLLGKIRSFYPQTSL